jgi:hypothetical protein
LIRRGFLNIAWLCLMATGSLNAQEEMVTVDTVFSDTVTVYDEYYPDDDSPSNSLFTQGFKRRDSFLWRNLPETVKTGWRQDKDFWYANRLPQEKRHDSPAVNRSLTGQQWFEPLLWIISLAGFACFIILYLMNNNISIFRKKDISLTNEDETYNQEDIFSIKYTREIEKAAANQNYRLAIRLLFLRLLKDLSDRNIIQYKPDRTNFDYLIQLSSTKYYNDFFRLTRNYEYSWYGKFEVNREGYARIKADFEKFNPSAV